MPPQDRRSPQSSRGNSNSEPDLAGIFDLKGKVALVTGAAGGIGSALVRGLAQFGADTVIVDLDEAAAGKLAADGTCSRSPNTSKPVR